MLICCVCAGFERGSGDPDIVSVIENMKSISPTVATPPLTPKVKKRLSDGTFVDFPLSEEQPVSHMLNVPPPFRREHSKKNRSRRNSWVPKSQGWTHAEEDAHNMQQLTAVMLGNITAQLETLSREVHTLRNSAKAGVQGANIPVADAEQPESWRFVGT